MPVKGGERAGLTEMFDPERAHPMTRDRAKPGERRRMSVEHGHDPAMRGHIGQQPLDMRARMHEPAFARALRRGPSGIEAIGRGHGEDANVAPVLRHQADRGDRFRRDRAGIGDDHLTIRSGRTHPVSAVDD